MSEHNINEENTSADQNKIEKIEPQETNDDVTVEAPISEEVISNHNAENEAISKSKKSKYIKDIVDYIELFVFAIGFVVLLFSFCCRLCTVSGLSMNNTLINDEKVVISDIFYTPKRGDIIVFHDTNTLNEPVVKRVIATAGEKVSIFYTAENMVVTITDIDGKTFILEEDYILYNGATYEAGEYEIPEGTVFVMGDNRSHSMDSRHPDIRFVDERTILGRVLFRVSPISKLGAVN